MSLLSILIEFVFLQEQKSGITSNGELLTKFCGILVGAVNFCNLEFIIMLLIQFLPSGSKVFAVSAPRSIEFEEPGVAIANR